MPIDTKKEQTRRNFLKAAAVTSGVSMLGFPNLLFGQQGPSIIKRNRKPNVLVVVTDQEQAWSELPSQLILPARQKLAAKATNFSNAHVVSPLCSMSRGNLYTGQHGQFNGLWENTPLPWGGGIKDGVPTMGHFFQDAGYTTGYTGKWHLTHMGINGGKTVKETKALFQQYGFDETFQGGERGGHHGGFKTDPITVEDSLRFIDKHKGADKPWFLTTNLVNPHDIMFFKTSEAQEKSRAGQFPDKIATEPDHPIYTSNHNIPFPENFGPATRQGKPAAHFQKEGVHETVLGEIPWNDLDAWGRFRNYYYNCLVDVDRHIDALLEGLEKSGEADNTIVLFVSDHGEMLGVHGHRGKGCLTYKEVTNVPLSIIHPDIRGGNQTEALTSHVDILPTLLSLIGLSDDEVANKYPFLKGRSFSSSLSAPNSLGAREQGGVLFQWSSLIYLDDESAGSFARIRAARGMLETTQALSDAKLSLGLDNRAHMRGVFDGRYKFARYFSPLEHHLPKSFENLVRYNDLELYDTHKDPGENINLAQSPHEHKAVIEMMNQKLNKLVKQEVGVDDGSHMPGPGFIWQL